MLEIFKTQNVLNPTYMKDLFYLRSSSARRPNDIALDHWDLRSGILYQNT